MDNKKMTILEIAQLCKVGTSTVSRVINKKPGVKEETRENIIRVMEKYNYIPNKSAQNLKRIKTSCIGIIVKEFSNPLFNKMIEIIERELKKFGYSILLYEVKSEFNEVTESFSFIKENRICGAIFLGGRFNHDEETLKKISIPFVFCTVTNKFGNTTNDYYSSISIDDEMEACKGVEYLIDLGHKDIAFLGVNTNDNSISELRYRGYLKAIQRNNLKLNKNLVISAKGYELPKVYKATTDLIDSKEKFTALFIISDLWALAVCKAFHDKGIKIPSDVSILGFDGIDIGKYCIPSLTTQKQPIEDMAKESVKIILNLIKGKYSKKQLTFTTDIIVRESCIKK